jgi:hypothetical protein
MEGWQTRLSDAVEAFVIIAGVGGTIAVTVGKAMDCFFGTAAYGGSDGSPC